ncbi:MAG: hypothetical protein F9K23_11530 [Bacteroidetes bacterium]|nr:MAG: hypothetical protein F9K23_11530 [Bacteroidota bacterium]
MKKLYILSILLLLLATSQYSCKPDDNGPVPEPYFVPTPQKIKDYTFFKMGSWWVYHDSVNNLYDTVVVTEINQGIDTFRKDGKVEFYYDWFTINTSSSYFGYNFNYYYSGSWGSLCWRTKTKPGNYVGQTICFFDASLNSKRYPYTQDGIVTFLDTASTMLIDSKQFLSVYRFEDSENITEGKKKTNFYFAKNVGIIKKVIDNSTVWKLVDYNISQ